MGYIENLRMLFPGIYRDFAFLPVKIAGQMQYPLRYTGNSQKALSKTELWFTHFLHVWAIENRLVFQLFKEK